MKRTAKAKVQTEQEQPQSIQKIENMRVVQANELIRAKQDTLTVFEARLIKLAIAQVLKDDTDLKTYEIGVTQLAKILDMPVTDKNIRSLESIKSALNKLRSKNITIETDKEILVFGWIDSARVDKKKKRVIFRLSEDLKPYILGLHELFARYDYESILKLPTNYSIRMYELLVSYESFSKVAYNTGYNNKFIGLEKGEIYFSVDYLRDFFDCVNKYPQTKEFMRNVIVPSIDAVNKHTELKIDYRTVRENRFIKYIVFRYFTRLEYSLSHIPDDDKEMQEKAERAKKAMQMVEEYKKRTIKEKSL